ncbi:hypothetical protein EIN_178730 [Entamoeba invadens IP1]|uniref:hypothetical protein n=1 Tax=Entamoeba invadens IP1 TaxID=370355 RepID=UPI0002C3EE6D|nr:hypothetical protein EIN_178730 [Entamoeba invadens IP1]ELP93916.1 hypothetical protein EIN_178730 [Entamoeba invadens IP1]|eukprot:XP_004260687.1 hypothetical protein EIN_178730 [Entamoeba invadens IP1]
MSDSLVELQTEGNELTLSTTKLATELNAFDIRLERQSNNQTSLFELLKQCNERLDKLDPIKSVSVDSQQQETKERNTQLEQEGETKSIPILQNINIEMVQPGKVMCVICKQSLDPDELLDHLKRHNMLERGFQAPKQKPTISTIRAVPPVVNNGEMKTPVLHTLVSVKDTNAIEMIECPICSKEFNRIIIDTHIQTHYVKM